MTVTASPRDKRSCQWSFWKTMKHVFICFVPINPSGSRRKEKSVAAASPLHSNLGSSLPSPDCTYNTMNAEERDENLKDLIAYCNKSKELGL
ncbi:hypothetical protein HRI_002587200 [Hibiscus trionum]|uniref:Uncharacterized protein n=1 Tax=Hibiscus trionum TaxID=183268 RepID=A0A9W7M669_HIBTR|nr:hypothetical protein HRI_002587200 [Hibiscus trionum]